MTEAQLAELIERAFDFRGYVTVSQRDGSKVIGFVYDRTPAHLELYDERAIRRIRLPITDIVDIDLSGEDSAAKAQAIWERRRGSLEPAATSVWGDWDGERSILAVVALPIELRSVARALGAHPRSPLRGHLGETPASVVSIGVAAGPGQAIADAHPALVITCGFAGALDPSLRTGDLVLASAVHDEHGDVLEVPAAILQQAREALSGRGVREGELICTTRVAATHAEKQALARRRALAVDLESAAVAHAAQRAGVPWLGLRAVLDPLALDLPAFTREMHDDYVGAVMRHVLAGPRAVAEIADLGWRTVTSARALERGLSALGRVASELVHAGARA